jgi:hypothetical protein
MNLIKSARALGFAVVALVMPSLAIPVQAQAWVPPPGEVAVSIAFQSAVVKKHYFVTERADKGRIDANSLTIDTSLGLTRKLAIDVRLPIMSSRGQRPIPGARHATFTAPRRTSASPRYNSRRTASS